MKDDGQHIVETDARSLGPDPCQPYEDPDLGAC